MNKPLAWAYIKDGEFWDAIHPDEHDKYEGMYTTPLYTYQQITPSVLIGASDPVYPVKELTKYDGTSYVINKQREELEFYEHALAGAMARVDKLTEDNFGLHQALAKPNQLKELTDEEIMDEWWHLTANGWEVEPDSQVQFARAILRKAQEK